MNVLNLIRKSGKKIALLLDTDKADEKHLKSLINQSKKAKVDFIFVGGSFITKNNFSQVIEFLKRNSKIPVVIFPGSVIQLDDKADAILFLSLISGRNPEMLIGNHIIAAPFLKHSGIEVIPTGYILIESGVSTGVVYMSNTVPIPYNQDAIAAHTALAGEYLGLKMMYIDAGSGAMKTVSESMIAAIKKNISLPLVVGGGIRTTEAAVACCRAGADIIVIGNAFEKDLSLLPKIANAVHNC
ncbi:MAG: geranylgeranylglyceryl/heptaprenylglyceryl phosphate synthase [Bacteroidales bacterium]|nr:geranylgeranylglyceryl/heptaprenylglyceryl phosphate synthase [Bacteroidales bacterium]